MIIPTAEHDPMYADDGVPFRTKMIHRIAKYARLPHVLARKAKLTWATA